MKKSTAVAISITLLLILSSLMCARGSQNPSTGKTPSGPGPSPSSLVQTPANQTTSTVNNATPEKQSTTVPPTQAQSSQPVAGSNSGPMTKMTVSQADSRNALCNDGTPAIYYIRRGVGGGSTRWLIHLQGGGFCYSADSCSQRQRGQEGNLMSSKSAPGNRPGNGILSASDSDNKFFAAYNEVYVGYCSSDFWSGNQAASSSTNGLQFRGAAIFQAVIADLSDPAITSSPNLADSTDIILSGSSAGGAGVLVHLDWLAAQYPGASVHGIDDAGWFMDIDPYDTSLPPVDQVVNQAYKFWNGSVDESCAAANPGAEGLCYLGPHVYPFLSTPLFVQIAQNDGPQLINLGISLPVDNAERAYAEKFAEAVRNSLETVQAAFSPAGRSHGLLASREYTSVLIGKQSIQDILGNWLFNLGGEIKAIDQP